MRPLPKPFVVDLGAQGSREMWPKVWSNIMEKEFDENVTNFQRELFEFIQDKLEDGMNAGAISSILVLHGAKIGLDIGVDPRIVAVNALSSVSKCFSDNLHEEHEEIEGEHCEDVVEHECDDDNVVYLNPDRVVH